MGIKNEGVNALAGGRSAKPPPEALATRRAWRKNKRRNPTPVPLRRDLRNCIERVSTGLNPRASKGQLPACAGIGSCAGMGWALSSPAQAGDCSFKALPFRAGRLSTQFFRRLEDGDPAASHGPAA